MQDEIKKVLNEFLKARDEVDKIIFHGELKAGEPIHYYTTEEFDALAKAFEKENEANKKYHILLFQKLGWSKKDIDDWLKLAGLI